jgi:hypothetical protein
MLDKLVEGGERVAQPEEGAAVVTITRGVGHNRLVAVTSLLPVTCLNHGESCGQIKEDSPLFA